MSAVEAPDRGPTADFTEPSVTAIFRLGSQVLSRATPLMADGLLAGGCASRRETGMMRTLARKPVPSRRLAGLRWGLFALGLTWCTDAGLQPKTGEVSYVDDQLEIDGEFCTSEPDEVAFPVKLLILMDQ